MEFGLAARAAKITGDERVSGIELADFRGLTASGHNCDWSQTELRNNPEHGDEIRSGFGQYQKPGSGIYCGGRCW